VIHPKPSNWLLVPALLYSVGCIVALAYGCSAGTTPHVETPTELCAGALAMSSEVRAQAAKIGLDPLELARKTCDAAILAARLTEANVFRAAAIAGAPNSASMLTAGVAGGAP
jgi:hypothetical protein